VALVLGAAGAGYAAGVVTFILGLLTTFAHVGAGWVVVDLAGAGGGGGQDLNVDCVVSSHGGAHMVEHSHHSGAHSLP
jgi:hypothetical protein